MKYTLSASLLAIGAAMAAVAFAAGTIDIEALMTNPSLKPVCAHMHHALLEEGDMTPPAFIFPDAAKDGDNTQYGWVDLSGIQGAITAHCFAGENETVNRQDIPLPAGTKTCKFAAGTLSCK